MPIVYETPAPLAAAAGVYDLAARNRTRAMSGVVRRGGGGGGGDFIRESQTPYDSGIQQAIQARDQMQFQQQAQAQEVGQRYDLARMGQESAAVGQRDRFELQAQLHEVELSQQERMRLQRLKNSVGEVMSDPTLTDEERKDYVQQIKYNIDPLQRRLAQEKVQQERIVKESMVEQKRVQAALGEEQLKVAAAKFDDRKVFDVPPPVLAEIVEDFTANVGEQLTAQFGPKVAQKMIGEMARQEAIKQGLGRTYFQQSPGKWQAMDGDGDLGGMSSGGGSGGEGGQPVPPGTGRGKRTSHPTGVDANTYDRIHAEVIRSVDEKLKLTKKSADGLSETPVYPQTPEWRKESIDSEFAARVARLKEYGAELPAEQQSGKRYQSKFAKAAAAATPEGESTLGRWGSREPAEGRAAEQPAALKQMVVADFDVQGDAILAATGISVPEKVEAVNALRRAKEIVRVHGTDPDKIPDDLKKEIGELRKKYLKIAGNAKPVPPVPPPSAPEPAPSKPWWERTFADRPR